MIGLHGVGGYPAEVVPLGAEVRFLYNGAIESGHVVGFHFGTCEVIVRPYAGGGDLAMDGGAIFRVVGSGREYPEPA